MNQGRGENRATRARALLLGNVGRVVTLREMADAGVCDFYTVRNACAEAKKLLGDGYTVTHVFSESGVVAENGYICEMKCAKQLELVA